MNKSKIEWCDSTWNPVTGCLHGCTYCYAEKIAKRFGVEGSDPGILRTGINGYPGIWEHNEKTCNPYPHLFKPTFHRYRLNEPEQKTKPQNIFVCSMADLFGDWVPDEWIDEVFQTCLVGPCHRYLFLTKNPKRYDKAIDYTANEERGFAQNEGYWDNFWFGTTINSQKDERRKLNCLTLMKDINF